MTYRKWIYPGIIVFVLSIVVGFGGTIWEINGSFGALKGSESAEIGQVGAGIKNAVLFTVISLIGSITGVFLIGVGIVKARRNNNR